MIILLAPYQIVSNFNLNDFPVYIIMKPLQTIRIQGSKICKGVSGGNKDGKKIHKYK